MTLTFTILGINTVTLTVKDNYGTSAIETLLVKVTNPLLVNIDGSMFLTDTDLNYLPLFLNHYPEVNVTISGGVVRTVNPRHVLEWINVTNIGAMPLQSLKLNELIPLDWQVSQALKPEKAVHVYFANTTSLETNPEITRPSTIAVSPGHPELIRVAIPSFNATEIGHPLMPSQTILLSIRLSYALIGTSQSAAAYPRYYAFGAHAEAWTMTGFLGTTSGNVDLFGGEFYALAKTVGNRNHEPTIV